MKVPFTWKVTGWFMVGWSAEFGASEVRPLRYFGEDLVAYRDGSGELHVLSGHCRHLGAHIGHGGKVVGDCVECPFHGWRWGPDGTNRYIPYQPDRPNLRTRVRDQRVRGLVEPPADLRLHPRRRRVLQHVLFDLVAPPSRRHLRCATGHSARPVERQFLGTVWEDLDIWRYQEYIERPPLSKVDAKPYMAMRKWATQFYEVPPKDAVAMKVDLADLVAPAHTAIVTQECQGAVVGPDAGLAVLANEARREALPNIERLLPAARDAGVKIVHCLVQRRPDGLGANHNAKIFAMGQSGVDISPGSPGAQLLPELGPAPSDLVLRRWHGIGPMGGTDLDAILRNLGVSTIVAVGVSVNVAITNLVMDAVNAAYRVVVPRDAVAGVPADYSDADHRQHAVAVGDHHDHRRSAQDME